MFSPHSGKNITHEISEMAAGTNFTNTGHLESLLHEKVPAPWQLPRNTNSISCGEICQNRSAKCCPQQIENFQLLYSPLYWYSLL